MELGAMPEKVSLNPLAKVTAGLAKDVDEVKKYAAPIQAGINKGATDPLSVRTTYSMMKIKTDVAMISESPSLQPVRTCVDSKIAGKPNMRFARTAPKNPPTNCETTYRSDFEKGILFFK